MMRTLRRILAIARKELLVLMGTRQSRFMVLIPPVIQIFIFAWAATMEVKNVDVVVINEDSGYWSQEVISRLRGSPTFRHITFEDDFKKAEEAINRQDVLVVMHFQNDFSAKVERGVPAEVQLLLDGRRSNTAQILTQYVQQIVQGLATATPAFVQAKPSRVEVEELNWFNPNLDFRWFILPRLIIPDGDGAGALCSRAGHGAAAGPAIAYRAGFAVRAAASPGGLQDFRIGHGSSSSRFPLYCNDSTGAGQA